MYSITLQNAGGDNAIESGDRIGRLGFAASSEFDGGASRYIVSYITSQAEGLFGPNNNPAGIVFATSSNDNQPAVERLRMSSEGHFIPLSGSAYDVGSNSLRFRTTYSDLIVASDQVSVNLASPFETLDVNGSIGISHGWKVNRGSASTSGAGYANGFNVPLNNEHGTTLNTDYVYVVRLSVVDITAYGVDESASLGISSVPVSTSTNQAEDSDGDNYLGLSATPPSTFEQEQFGNLGGANIQTGSSYLVWYNTDESVWVARPISEAGDNNAHCLLTTQGANAIAYTPDISSYEIFYVVETYFNDSSSSLPHFMGSDFQWQRIYDNLYYNDGPVGIGTSFPNAGFILDVAGSGRFEAININGQYTLPTGVGAIGDSLVYNGSEVIWSGTQYADGSGLSLVGTTLHVNVDSAVQSVSSNSVTSTASRTYAIQVDSNDNLVVNVPFSGNLSGDINLNNFDIAGTGNITVNGTFSANSINVNDQFTFPTTDGSSGQALVTDGSGSVSWSGISGGVDSISFNTSDGVLTLGRIGDLSDLTVDLDGRYLEAHPATSPASSSDNSGRTYIQDILLDSYGHVTGITTAIETVTDTDTTYTDGSGLSLVGTTFHANVDNATQSVAPNSVSSTASRTYAVQVDSSDNLVVNVPWVDTDTNISLSGNLVGDLNLNNYDIVGTGNITIDGDVEANQFIGNLTGAIYFTANAGEALTKGDAVYISGISGNKTVVSKADANDSSKMPAFGIAAETVNDNANVNIITFGSLYNIDTDTPDWHEGDELYVSNIAGTLSKTAPTGESSQIQKIAKVTRRDNSAGSIKVMGAGRSNATPNLNKGRLFVGNSSNQAVADGTIDVDISNNRVGIGKTPSVKLDVDGEINSINASNNKFVVKTNTIAAKIQPYDATLATYIGNETEHKLIFRTYNRDRVIISEEGDLGVGIDPPRYKLDVNGTARFNSTIYAPNIGTGVDNSVVILDSDGKLHTDEIDGRVWGSSLVDGTGATNRLSKWSDSNTLTSSNISDNETTVSVLSDLVISGDLTVNGTTVYANVDKMQVVDPIIHLGLSSGNVITDTTYDRGIALELNGSTTAFMGYDVSASEFVLLDDATGSNNDNNYASATYGDLHVGGIETENSVLIEGGVGRVSSTNDAQFAFVGGGNYSSNATQGYIKITLPVSWTNTMMSFDLDIYEWGSGPTNGLATKITIGGYNYISSSRWLGTTAHISSDYTTDDYRVQFGHDGTKCSIYISKNTTGGLTTWNFPVISINDVKVGHIGGLFDSWDKGWVIGVTPILGTISPDAVHTLNTNKIDGNTIVLSDTDVASGASVIDNAVSISLSDYETAEINGLDASTLYVVSDAPESIVGSGVSNNLPKIDASNNYQITESVVYDNNGTVQVSGSLEVKDLILSSGCPVVISNTGIATGSDIINNVVSLTNAEYAAQASANNIDEQTLYVITDPNAGIFGAGTQNYVARWTSDDVLSTGVIKDDGAKVTFNPGTNQYSFPTQDGSFSQILVTDGNGNLTFKHNPSYIMSIIFS